MAKKRKKRPRRPREATPAAQPAAVSQTVARKRAAAADERPPAPWGSFPLVEICVFIGLVLVVGGFIAGGQRGGLAIGVGIGLAGLGGLELAIREHFAGFRSHSALLAGVPAIAALAALFYAGPESLGTGARIAIALGLFIACFFAFSAMFKRKAGVAFKVR